jgi:cytochrome b subunit of formate dehydrogenase
VLAALLALTLAAAGAAPAAAQLDIACTDCHEVEVTSPVHGAFDCTDCHTGIDDVPHPEEALAALAGGQICAQCHDVGDELAASVHADVSCTDCHGSAHELLPSSELESPVSPIKQFQTCGSCHDSPPGLIEGYLASVHARALLVSGLVNAPSCTNCHGVHDISPVSDERSHVSRREMPETCGSCHVFILETWENESAHGLAWKAGNLDVPICTTCHASHEVLRPTREATRLKFPESCGNCHSEEYTTYRDSFHGAATDLGYMTAAICSDCHTPHQNLAASDPRSSIHPANLRATCGTCHGEVSEAFISFDPHADPRDAGKNPWVHGVWLFMTALLIGVFGFFGLHHALWLQRSVVGVFRGDVETHPKQGRYIRRFTRGQVRTHLVMVTTFLVLAATGLPLKFHDTPWAQSIADLLGGVGTTSLIHRFAAVLTFGYFLVHLGGLFRRVVLRKEPGYFWGWRSMVPRPKDFQDLYANIRYFLYLGPRPKLDRWTYWEKFDYFAVFWGVAIIGVSGLMLWADSLVTRLLPGWTLNVAFLIHSDEALLATGFIFIFHFFHTHLRPESFPLDPVIFTGRMSLQRFKEERPLEYQRLADSGELEKHLVNPPTGEDLRFARAFGFTALTIGLVLAFAILWGLISH